MDYNKDLKYISELFTELSDDSRLWIFQSDRQLSPNEERVIESNLAQFLPRWTSHNRQLIARGGVAYGYFVIIALDESQSSSASGCSIDAMTHVIQALSQELDLNLLDRSTFYFMVNEKILGLGMNDLSTAVAEEKVTTQTPVFNNLVAKKSELASNWMIPLSESWHKRFL